MVEEPFKAVALVGSYAPKLSVVAVTLQDALITACTVNVLVTIVAATGVLARSTPARPAKMVSAGTNLDRSRGCVLCAPVFIYSSISTVDGKYRLIKQSATISATAS